MCIRDSLNGLRICSAIMCKCIQIGLCPVILIPLSHLHFVCNEVYRSFVPQHFCILNFLTLPSAYTKFVSSVSPLFTLFHVFHMGTGQIHSHWEDNPLVVVYLPNTTGHLHSDIG